MAFIGGRLSAHHRSSFKVQGGAHFPTWVYKYVFLHVNLGGTYFPSRQNLIAVFLLRQEIILVLLKELLEIIIEHLSISYLRQGLGMQMLWTMLSRDIWMDILQKSNTQTHYENTRRVNMRWRATRGIKHRHFTRCMYDVLMCSLLMIHDINLLLVEGP